MSTMNLINSMRAQAENLDLLIETLNAQKQAITKNDYTALEKAVSNEQMVIRKIEVEENNRIEAVKEINRQFNLENHDYSLEKVLNKGKNFFGKELRELLQLRKILKEKVQLIKNLNLQLKYIIEFSRGLIKETLLIAAGSNKHVLVNKRV